MFKNYDEYLHSTLEESSACADCHNAGTVLTGKVAQFNMSVHGAGVEGESAFELAWAEGTRASCAGCHSGNGFSDMIAAGQNPSQVTVAQTDPTRVDCRACHEIHETFTGADWALRTVAPVDYYAGVLVGKTFNGGAGNLCANCHQPRVAFAGDVTLSGGGAGRYGPHHGPQSAMLQGIVGAGAPASAGAHYMVTDTCVGCHMGANDTHLFEVNLANNCKPCHGDDIDDKVDELQAEVQALADELKAKLVAAGMLNEETEASLAGTWTGDKAAALWDYRTIIVEDKSLGVHNPNYTKALLNAGIAAFD